MSAIQVYRGDPLSLVADLEIRVDGVVQTSLPQGTVVEARLRNATGVRLANLTVTPATGTQVPIEAAGSSTAAWPVGALLIRLRLLLADGLVIRSPQIQVDLVDEG